MMVSLGGVVLAALAEALCQGRLAALLHKVIKVVSAKIIDRLL